VNFTCHSVPWIQKYRTDAGRWHCGLLVDVNTDGYHGYRTCRVPVPWPLTLCTCTWFCLTAHVPSPLTLTATCAQTLQCVPQRYSTPSKYTLQCVPQRYSTPSKYTLQCVPQRYSTPSKHCVVIIHTKLLLTNNMLNRMRVEDINNKCISVHTSQWRLIQTAIYRRAQRWHLAPWTLTTSQ